MIGMTVSGFIVSPQEDRVYRARDLSPIQDRTIVLREPRDESMNTGEELVASRPWLFSGRKVLRRLV
jgi:hypothetical protein